MAGSGKKRKKHREKRETQAKTWGKTQNMGHAPWQARKNTGKNMAQTMLHGAMPHAGSEEHWGKTWGW